MNHFSCFYRFVFCDCMSKYDLLSHNRTVNTVPPAWCGYCDLCHFDEILPRQVSWSSVPSLEFSLLLLWIPTYPDEPASSCLTKSLCDIEAENNVELFFELHWCLMQLSTVYTYKYHGWKLSYCSPKFTEVVKIFGKGSVSWMVGVMSGNEGR